MRVPKQLAILSWIGVTSVLAVGGLFSSAGTTAAWLAGCWQSQIWQAETWQAETWQSDAWLSGGEAGRRPLAVQWPDEGDDFHSLVQEPSRRRAQRPQLGNPLRDMNQRSSIQMLGAFREAIGNNWKGTVELIADEERVAYGAVVDRDGWIISKDSQIPRDGKLICRFANGRESLAETVEHNSALDLVLLRVPDRDLETIQWADDVLPQRGNWVATTDTRSIPVAVGVVSAGVMTVSAKKVVLGVLLGDAETGDGTLILRVLRGTGADLAGLRVGDRIRSINGQRLNDREAAESLLRSCRAGQSIQLAIVRGQDEIETHAQMMDLANELHDETEMEVNGLVSARSSGFNSVFLHDTVLLPSQCGGPLVDLNGRVVGINIARAGRVTSYALPTSTVRPEVERMLAQAKGSQVIPANANVSAANTAVR